MIKINDKVYHYSTMNKIGTVVRIFHQQNNQLTTGGTTASRVYVEVLYPNNEKIVYNIGDLQKHFD